MRDIKLALMTGVDIPIPECQLVLHQPTIKEISYLGDSAFLLGLQTLTLYKSMFLKDKSVLDDYNNFQIFMTIMSSPETKDNKEYVVGVLNNLLFPKYKLNLTPRSMIFINPEDSTTSVIDESNFDMLQEYLREVFNTNSNSQDSQSFNPANEKAREIAEKLMRGRARVAAQKGENTGSIFGQYISILAIGMNIPVTTLADYTVYQLYDALERYSLWINWDLDIKQRLAGGKPDSSPDNWMKNIH